MNMTKTRGAGYLIAAAIGMGVVAMNFGTFDAATGMVDLAPINLYVAVGGVWAILGAPVMALVAVIRGWGKK